MGFFKNKNQRNVKITFLTVHTPTTGIQNDKHIRRNQKNLPVDGRTPWI
jgi:hypothetical protein